MPQKRAAILLFTILLAAPSLTGCASNMGDLKRSLGLEKAPPAPPAPLPPRAKAAADATTVSQGAIVRFTAAGSSDPAGSALSYDWRFGDGGFAGEADTTHGFDTAGSFRVVLTVTNEQHLTDQAFVLITVAPGNRPPVAHAAVTDAKGHPATYATPNDPLTFSSAGSSDPDGDPLTFDWDLGDGTAPHDATVTHAYNGPGDYLVKLTVSDNKGHSDTASRIVAITYDHTFNYAWDATDRATARDEKFPLGKGIRTLTITLAFDAALGTNDLTLKLQDANHTTVRTGNATIEPLQQGNAQIKVVLPADELRTYAAGTWTATITRTQPRPGQSYALTVAEKY